MLCHWTPGQFVDDPAALRKHVTSPIPRRQPSSPVPESAGQQAKEKLFGILEDGNIDTYKDWKGRYKQNLDKMKTGQLIEVADVLKNLCLVSQKKSLSFREKKMYERAKYFIVSEVAHVRDIEELDAEAIVEGALEKSLAKLKKAKAKTEKAEAAAG